MLPNAATDALAYIENLGIDSIKGMLRKLQVSL